MTDLKIEHIAKPVCELSTSSYVVYDPNIPTICGESPFLINTNIRMKSFCRLPELDSKINQNTPFEK